jgi:photosystem II stability/assembly factor-like uncharacterized protein
MNPTSPGISVSQVFTIFVLAILCVLSGRASAYEWRAQGTIPARTDLRAVWFVDANTATAVGGYGTIVRTTDGGITWNRQLSPASAGLYDVCFTDVSTGTAVGLGAVVLRTLDGGEHWFQQDINLGGWLRGVHFVDSNTGTAVGYESSGDLEGAIFRTENGGETWIRQQNTGRMLTAVWFADENTGWAVGDQIYSTTDGGDTWTLQPSPENSGFNDVMFVSDFRGFVAGNAISQRGRIFDTWTSGTLWSKTVFAEGTFDILALWFVDSYNGTAVGDSGLILRRDQHTANWLREDSGVSEHLTGVSFANESTGIIVGTKGTVLTTTNGGDTWFNWGAKRVFDNDLYDVSFIDASTGTAVGTNGAIWHTTDGGETWIPQSSATIEALFGVWQITADRCVAVGRNGTIVSTTNGGTDWVEQTSGTSNYLMDVTFSDSVSGTAVGYGGTILKTDNGGADWISQSSGSANHFYSVSFVDASTGIAVGDEIVVYSTDGGEHWLLRTSPTADGRLSGVSLVAPNTAIAVSYPHTNAVGTWSGPGRIYRTADGGVSWEVQWQSYNHGLFDVSFSDVNNGTVIGINNFYQKPFRILHTTDGGTTWHPDPLLISKELRGVCFTDAETGTIVGHDGTILRTDGTFTAVFVTGFKAESSENGIELEWSISADEDISYFQICRSKADESSEHVINELPVPGTARRYVDRTANYGCRYQYTLVAYGDQSGAVRSAAIEVERTSLAVELFQNSPNPFNPVTSIRYTIPDPSTVTLRVYAPSGKLVRTILTGKQPAGTRVVEWDGRNDAGNRAASGVYVYRLRVGKTVLSRKMTLLK